MLLAAIALIVADPAPAPVTAVPSISEAAHALDMGRLDQARAMLDAAVAAGAKGESVDRLTANLAFARGDFGNALAAYRTVLTTRPQDAEGLERAGIAALHLGDVPGAVALLDRATAQPTAGWRAWNARGVAADREGRWAEADAAYRRADSLSAGHAEIANNRGWSAMLQGHWAPALSMFRQAAAINPDLPRLTANLELAEAAIAAQLPPRRRGEGDDDYAARLNDAGVIAEAAGQIDRARAAFAQAIELKTRWNDRAARNLDALGHRQ